MFVRKHWRKFAIGGACLFLLLLIWPLFAARFRNDVLSDYFLAQLTCLKPGGGTAVCKTFSEIGILAGNGNHCDFFQLVIFKTGLSREEVRMFYDRFGESVYFLKDDETIILEALSHYHIDGLIAQLKEEIAELSRQKGNYFLRYSFVSLDCNADWRCH